MTTEPTSDVRLMCARTNGVTMSERARDVREVCATPALPTPPTYPLTPNEGSSQVKGSVPRANDPAGHDDERWLIGYRREMDVITLLGFTPDPVAAVLRKKPWATLIRGNGWTFPLRYLEHVERLLDGANVELFDTAGDPTPRQAAETRLADRAATKRVIAELRAARDAATADPLATRQARNEARAAFDEAIAAKHANDEAEAAS